LDVGVVVLESLTSEGVGVGLEVIGAYYIFQAIKILIDPTRVVSHGQTVFENCPELTQLRQKLPFAHE